MSTESAIFTALPNGVHQGGDFLRVTAFVSPRLATGPAPTLPLSSFPSFRNWPVALAGAQLAVEIQGVGMLDTRPDPDAPAANEEIWRLLFAEDDVNVATGRFRDLSGRTLHSFPADDVAGVVLDLYAAVASLSATEYPPVTQGPVAATTQLLGRLASWREGVPRPGGDIVNAEQRAFLAVAQALRFYHRGARQLAGPGAAPAPPEPPRIDFHGYVAFMGDYPGLLRRLGLAVDLVARIPPGLAPEGLVRIHVENGPAFAALEAARPWTHYALDGSRFLARPRDAEGGLVDGMLRLETPDFFAVHQIDIDGSALKTVDYIGNVLRMTEHLHDKERSMTADALSLPALRTGGFVVVRKDRAAAVGSQLEAAATHAADIESGAATELFAEDVTRGSRVDVQDAGTWRSLCERTGSYVVTREGTEHPVAIDDDEGFVKGSSTTSTGQPGDTDLYLHEAVFGWDGWSLVAKRPGRPVVDAQGGSAAGGPEAEPPPDFPLVTAFQPRPGSLPRLRFGHEYRFRARAVDLAGNSVHEADIDPTHASPHPDAPPHRFFRFEPVPSPAVVPRRRFSEGESLLRMVIRSTLDVSPEEYVALARVRAMAGHDDAGTAYRAANDRHVAPPKTSVQFAEWHGMFDKAVGAGRPKAARDAGFDIAATEAGSFIDAGPGAFVVNTDPETTPTDLATHVKGDPLQPGEYVCRDTDDLGLPYLPDPASGGCAFTVLPGDAASRKLPWKGAAWPNLIPVLVRLEHGGLAGAIQKAPKPEDRLLRVFLRQAEMVTVRISSFPRPARDGVPAALDLMGVWDMVAPAVRDAQLDDAESGRHWMLTPYQEFTLVHAVEKPLAPPDVAVAPYGIGRAVGETFAALTGAVNNHAESTGRLDVEATWEEPIDDVAQGAPSVLAGAAHVADFQLESDESACRIGRDDTARAGAALPVHRARHEFGDTKHRDVAYQAVATTRFREYFPRQVTDDPALVTHVGPRRTLDIPSSKRPDPPEVLYVLPTFSWEDDSFRALLPEVRREDLTPAMARAVDALSPRLRRVVGQRAVMASEVASGVRLPAVRRRTRRAGLRVYLSRPWYSSGAGELLAVVVPDQPYLTWSIDAGRGLVVGEVSRARADEVSAQILAGRATPACRARPGISASERLLGTLGGRAAGRATPPPATGALTTTEAAELAEILGSIVSLPHGGDPEGFVTRYGQDPIWGSDAPSSGPWIHQFGLRHTVATGLDLAATKGSTVTAIGHLPRYDTERKLWYCDIDIDAGSSYFPFVRLALARYQPSSVQGVHLSAVVVPEWAQLVAPRTATLSRSGGVVRVAVRGPAGYTGFATGLLGPLQAKAASGMAISRFVVAGVERLPTGATTDLAWVPVGQQVRLDVEVARAHSDVTFSGAVKVPAKATGEKLRVALAEYEILPTDPSQAQNHIRHSVIKGKTGGGGAVPGGVPNVVTVDHPVRCRLVYADHIDL